MIIEKLFWEKYRPKSIGAMILLPRIEKQVTKDDEFVITGNLLFTGSSSGTGKSSLANLIAGKHALKINASYNSSVEDLKENVMDFCRQVGDGIFDDCNSLTTIETNNDDAVIIGYCAIHYPDIVVVVDTSFPLK